MQDRRKVTPIMRVGFRMICFSKGTGYWYLRATIGSTRIAFREGT